MQWINTINNSNRVWVHIVILVHNTHIVLHSVAFGVSIPPNICVKCRWVAQVVSFEWNSIQLFEWFVLQSLWKAVEHTVMMTFSFTPPLPPHTVNQTKQSVEGTNTAAAAHIKIDLFLFLFVFSLAFLFRVKILLVSLFLLFSYFSCIATLNHHTNNNNHKIELDRTLVIFV